MHACPKFAETHPTDLSFQKNFNSIVVEDKYHDIFFISVLQKSWIVLTIIGEYKP